jgi:hypothetical protein
MKASLQMRAIEPAHKEVILGRRGSLLPHAFVYFVCFVVTLAASIQLTVAAGA